MTFQLTEEQNLCIEAAKTSESLLINALAGAAKTSTLCLMAQKLPLVPTLCCAFNKRIATEMEARMPSHIQCSTMNSIGHRAWGQKVGKKLFLDPDKSYRILTETSEKLTLSERRNLIGDSFGDILRALRLCKSAGYVPNSMSAFGESLCSQESLVESFARQLDLDSSGDLFGFLDKCLEVSISEAFSGKIDFDDQVYMSTLFEGSFVKFPIIMIDESQDLSPLNHKTIERMFSERVIAVGDPNQAIYAFRGASHSSMAELKDHFQMRELTLSCSFRCPQSVVENARWRVPHMLFPDWAILGEVGNIAPWNESNIPEGAAVICRNNAPIFRTAIRLIKAGRSVKILGNDIGAGLVKQLKKFGPETLSQNELLQEIDKWKEAQLEKSHKARQNAIHDKTDCFRVFALAGATLGESISYAQTIFSASGKIELMTGHKAKGGEWDTVFHLDSFLLPSKFALRAAESGDESQLIQENNLRYVVDTRSKNSLYYINSEDYIP